MNELAFVEKRKTDWERLQWLCDKADISPRQLDPAEYLELVKVYRRVSGDLALVRTQSANLELANYLNTIVSRGYNTLYRPNPGSFWKGVAYVIETYAQTARRCWVFIMLSLLTLVGGAVFGGLALSKAPDTRDLLIPPGYEEVFDQWKAGTFQERTDDANLGAMAGYMSNNPRVALMTGTISAATFGIGSFYILFQNGLLLGTLTHEVAQTNRVGHLYVSIAPHGVTELQGAIIAGASGYVMGWGLIAPGRRTRGESFRVAMKDAFILLVGGIVMMYMAAPIEGFFSFDPNVPPWLKAVFAVVGAIAWALFYAFVGRRTQPAGTLQP